MENGPFEDVCPIKNGNIPASYVIVYQRVDLFASSSEIFTKHFGISFKKLLQKMSIYVLSIALRNTVDG